jgi:ABC-2 type transport system ATP-binding protein
MRRRLDVALGIVHRPEVLFLDEPTTGLDPQARANMWDEIRRLREQGTTIFLTTHYLEEADALCDRLAIIDHGRIVAEGTPTALKAEIGRPTVEITPADPEQRDRVADILRRFGELVQVSPGSVAVRCAHGDLDLAEIIRALDSEDLSVANLQLHAPSLDDVFLEKTGRTLEGAAAEADAEAVAEPARR